MVLCVHYLAIKEEFMKELNKNEMLEINGGSVVNSALISALVKGASTFLEIGRSLGSSIRRLIANCKCDI